LSIEGNPSIVISLIFILLGISSILYLRFKKPTGNKFVQQILSLIMPAFFTSGFLSHAIFIRNYEEGLSWMFILIIIISLNDIGAFIFGKLIGKIPFFPKISPNKTFEGSLSGIFLGTLGGLTYKFLTGDPEISMSTIFMLSIALTIFGQMGDLFESGMKRLSGIKDSGNIIPGHGGVMDRQDSFVFAIPVLYYFIQWKAI
jgi:phosphatidate cytidylyltransferase